MKDFGLAVAIIVCITLASGPFFVKGYAPQKAGEPPRMSLELSCPQYVVAANQPMTVQADVVGARQALGEAQANLISYRWEVAGAEIVRGQGTPNVTVDAGSTSRASHAEATLTVTLTGVPPYFARKKSCTIKFDPSCAKPQRIDEYMVSDFSDEKPFLNRLAKKLIESPPEAVAFLILYAGRDSCLWEAEFRGRRAKSYLVEQHKIDPDRVNTIDGGFRERLTVDVFVASRSSCGPFPAPTIMRSQTKGLESCDEKYK